MVEKAPNPLFDFYYDLLTATLGAPDWLAMTLWFLITALAIIGIALGLGGLMSYIFRKVFARMGNRVGPNRVGPFGLLQFLADGIKFIAKEEVMPLKADKWGYKAAPFFVILPVILSFTPLPFGNGIILADLTYGLLFILAVSALSPIGEILAGWASNNKYSMIGGIRTAALDVSYEIPMVLSAASIVLLTGAILPGESGLNTLNIVHAQEATVWFFILQPIGAFIFFASALAKAGIVPMDLPESESELVAGYFTEYGGMRFGVLFVGVFINIVFIAALTVTLFFGGWTIPFANMIFSDPNGPLALIFGVVWFFLKTAFFVFMVLATWLTLPRVRADQFLRLGWKVLFPLALLNLVLTMIEIYVLQQAQVI
ncbi:MAG TPA: NADH-quinone oxidoreductase subunit NuoH [Candidatus Thermoplasmatota archaeon]|nr:NADH-quinone oxidoreductase subunit NuoH [Candidatus Thermoplasmatota archaeon]